MAVVIFALEFDYKVSLPTASRNIQLLMHHLRPKQAHLSEQDKLGKLIDTYNTSHDKEFKSLIGKALDQHHDNMKFDQLTEIIVGSKMVEPSYDRP